MAYYNKYLIPDKCVECRYCNFCYKPLTIRPVKSYPDLKLKCGRCLRGVANDTNCRPALFANLELFSLHKCLNRFDGCRHVFALGKATSHELFCQPQYYACPVCPHRPTIPTFFTMIHFKRDHEAHILKDEAIFKVDLTLEGFSCHLYPIGDNLFFLEYYKPEGDAFSLNAYFVGTMGLENTTQQFKIIYDNSSVYETETKRICYHNEEDPQGFVLRKPNECKFATVQACLNLQGLELALASNCLIKPPSDVSLPRTILLKDNVIPTFFAESHTLKVRFAGRNLVIDMQCVLCSAAVFGQHAKFIEIEPPDKFQAVCSICFEYLSSEWPATPFKVNGMDFPDTSRLIIMYSCIWKSYHCQQFIPFRMLVSHEVTCLMQPFRICPKRGCFYTGKLCDLAYHFANNHPTDRIIMVRRVLEFTESPNVTEYFVFALHGFVNLEVYPSDSDDDHYHVYFRREAVLETFGKPQARVLICVQESNSYVLLKDNYSLGFTVGTRIKVWCYFD